MIHGPLTIAGSTTPGWTTLKLPGEAGWSWTAWGPNGQERGQAQGKEQAAWAARSALRRLSRNRKA